MTADRPCLEPGTLWPRLVRQTERALARGVLRPLQTRTETLPDAGMPFQVRVAANLARKAAARRRPDPGTGHGEGRPDPFLPWEPELFVADVTPRHVCLLNKFNVLDHHLLVVTRQFVDQERLLELDDFEALWRCLAEFDALGFYNGGATAGASERHRHLQLVPLPLGGSDGALPLSALLGRAPGGATLSTVPGLAFRHVFAPLDSPRPLDPAARARTTFALYRAMLQAAGIAVAEPGPAPRQGSPYNLLVTRDWMLLVPRREEHAEGISINALAYAGSLFVRDAAQLERVRRAGPMTLLEQVAEPLAERGREARR